MSDSVNYREIIGTLYTTRWTFPLRVVLARYVVVINGYIAKISILSLVVLSIYK